MHSDGGRWKCMEAGGAIDVLAAYRESKWRERKAQERKAVGLGAGIV